MSTPALPLSPWQQALLNARRRSPASFDQWFSGVQFDRLEGDSLELTARDEFVRDWIKTHFLPSLLSDLRRLLATDEAGAGETNAAISELRVQWRIDANLREPIGLLDVPTGAPGAPPADPDDGTGEPPTVARGSSRPPPARRSRATEGPGRSTASRVTRGPTRSGVTATTPATLDPGANWLPVGDPINPKHTFPNFVVGPSNELAYAAAIASAGEEGPRYNPLFICGGTGLGKTHLVHSIAHRLLETRPSCRILYLSAERFTNEFIEALQHHRMEEFRARYRRSCDALLMDDIQFLAGREQTQEEFFHTFNALRDLDRPIVVTSDKYPQELQRMPERLISRFTSGLVADVQTPALETRVAIIRKKAALEAIPLDDEVAVLLAQQIKSNVRELEGTLIRLAAKSSLLNRPIDVEFARSELRMVNPVKPETTSVEDIQRIVCGHFSLTNGELLSKNRHKSVAFARQVAMYLCRQRLKCSFPELGRAFGNRDHTTVISACRRVESLRNTDPQVNAHLQALENKLTAEG